MDKVQEQAILQHAWRFGHFRNPAPECRNAHNVEAGDVRQLTLADEPAKEAVRSLQGIDAQFDTLVGKVHKRAPAVEIVDEEANLWLGDGDAGQATLDLVDLPRCGCPDYGTEYGLENAGSGGWNDCDPGKVFPDAQHSKAIRFDESGAPAKWRGYLDKVKENAVKISADMGLAVRHLPASTTENFQSSCIFRFISGGVIGFYYIPQGNTCRRVPQGALDTSYQPDVQMASILWIHEGLGHGVGLQHTRGGIMNPSIIRVPITWRGDPSERRMRQMYTGEPLGPDPGPGPGPTPPKVIHTWTATKAGQKFSVVEGTSGNGGWEI